MEANRKKSRHLTNGNQPLSHDGLERRSPSVPTDGGTPSWGILPANIQTPLDKHLIRYILSTENYALSIEQCGPLEHHQLSDWASAVLHKDYFFKTGHWQRMLQDPIYQVYAITIAPLTISLLRQLIGLAITSNHSSLLNLYIDPEWRSKGIGKTVMEILSPETIRAKTNMTNGDPTNFYEAQGYRVLQTKQGKNGTITVLQRKQKVPPQ